MADQGRPNDLRTVYDVELECRHTLRMVIPPQRKGEALWCVRCQNVRKVAHLIENWKVICETCSYRRQQGLGRVSASARAARHRSRHINHTVSVFKNDVLEYRFKPQQERLPIGDDEPPF